MGDQFKHPPTMRSTILFVSLALLATALAIPSDGVVPEEQLLQDVLIQDAAVTVAHDQELLQSDARAYAESMLQKSGSNACETLAKDTMDEVKKNVEAAQKLMDKLDNGAACEHTGKKEVEKADLALTQAKSTLTDAQKAYDSAADAKINFGDFKLSQLQEGSCSIFFNSKTYTDAKAKRTAAKTKLDKAKGAKSTAETELQSAKDKQQAKAEKCACEVKDMHVAKLGDINKDVEAANIKAWTQAYHLKCVLDGTKASDCKVPPVPKVKAAKLSSFADAAKCSIEGHLKDKCDGWAVDGSACGNGKVGYQIFSGVGEYKYYQQGRPELYQCPKGWHWAKDAEYFNYMASRNCQSNNQRASQSMRDYSGYSSPVFSLFQKKNGQNCGWTNYNPPNGPNARYYVIPSDFGKTTNFASSGCSFNPNLDYKTAQPCHGRYQHLGNYAGYQSNVNTNVNNGHWAGIICMQD